MGSLYYHIHQLTILPLPMQPRISMITLGVDNLQKAIACYEQGLRFPQMESSPEVAFFTLNGTWLSLYGRKALAEDGQVPFEPGQLNSCTLAHHLSSEQEVDEVYGPRCRCNACKTATKSFLGRLFRLFQKFGWAFLGNCSLSLCLGWS